MAEPQPTYNQSPGFLQDGKGIHKGYGIIEWAGDGAPVDGTSGTGVDRAAAKGSKYIDKNTGVEYRNYGTAASPTWIPNASES